MRRINFSDLEAFVAIVRAGSFRKAAAERGVSGPAMSQALQNIEDQLGMRLLNRTTRSIALTEAGDMLMSRVSISFDNIREAVDAVQSLRGETVGRLRINAPMPAVDFVLSPLLPAFLKTYPGVSVELIADNSLVDMVSEGFDAGVRYGSDIARDMIAVPIGKPLKYIVVGAPDYFAAHEMPVHPRDLLNHDCIKIRFPGGAYFEWDFRKGDEEFNLLPDGRFTTSDARRAISAALSGVGLAFIIDGYALPELETGKLVQVLEDWTPATNRWSLYYPSRRQMPAALRAFIDFVKQHAG